METAQATPTPQRYAHKRSRSAALKSIVTPSRPPSPMKKSPTKVRGNDTLPPLVACDLQFGLLPQNHSHSAHAVLGEIHSNKLSKAGSPRKTHEGRDDVAAERSREARKPPIFALLSPTRKTQVPGNVPKDKENTTPPGTASAHAQHTPIWSQFTSQFSEDPFKIPQTDHRLPTNTTAADFGRLDRSSDEAKRYSKENSNPQPRTMVGNAIAILNARSEPRQATGELDAAFEAVLNARNIPQNMRHNMRMLDPTIKAEFIRNAKTETPKGESSEPTKSSFWGTLSRGRSRSTAGDRDEVQPSSPSKRSRSRSRTFTLTKSDRSPTKRARSSSRPRSLMLLKNLSSSSLHSIGHDGTSESKEQSRYPGSPEENKDALKRPDDFIKYLRGQQVLQEIEVGKLHKLRLLLRNETVSWVDTFILKDGMTELLRLLNRLREIEWRDEHDDLLLHEVLLCLKGLCTTERALNQLAEESSVLFPNLLNMLFDEERRGPSEFNTRGIIINLLYTHLVSTPTREVLMERVKSILSYLSDPGPAEDAKPVGFIMQMQQKRPYLRWCKEITNVTKEVFWIFLHHPNVISIPPMEEWPAGESYAERHLPKSHPPVPAASWVGGVEWEACNYLTSHLDVMNGLIASLPTLAARNDLRGELRASGFEKIMGQNLRTCKEKFYGSIHDALRTWILAAAEDGWEVRDVKMGPPKEESSSKSPIKSPKKGENKAPRLELPKLDLGVKSEKEVKEEDGWL